MEDQVLRASDGKRRDEHLAPDGLGVLENREQLIACLIQRLVVTVSIGGFEEHHVRGHGCCGISQNR